MNWSEVTCNWPAALARLQVRFPHIDRTEFSEPPTDRRHLARHLAERHDLTQFEADEELRDWLYVEALARQVPAQGD
ncbi:MAG: hypothetical protein KDK26_17175 [Roseivivax sp.]|nr:hypothetical protein [Roseivivax sp.]